MTHSHRVYDAIKRACDVLVAALVLVLLSPVLAVLAILVRRELGSPVIYRQARPGLGGHIFTLYKFRSMASAPAAATLEEQQASDEARLTPFGRRLRSTSLDELPSLFNVLRGDMSIVGPRPLLPEYLERYNAEQARRHEVRPGITGWAQVNGRNATSWEERFEMDVWYVDHRSALLDLRILGRTIGTVFSRSNVDTAEGTTMPVFDPRRDDPEARR